MIFLNRFSKQASISVYTSDVPFRTSTNPVIFVLTQHFNYPGFQDGDNVRWLPLSPDVGIMLFMTDALHQFNGLMSLPINAARTLNRVNLTQILNMQSVNQCIATDNFLDDDLLWAGFSVDKRNKHKFRKS